MSAIEAAEQEAAGTVPTVTIGERSFPARRLLRSHVLRFQVALGKKRLSEPEQLAAMWELLEAGIAPEAWAEAEAALLGLVDDAEDDETGAERIWKLIGDLFEAQTGFPTKRSQRSSTPSSGTTPSSTVASSSPVVLLDDPDVEVLTEEPAPEPAGEGPRLYSVEDFLAGRVA